MLFSETELEMLADKPDASAVRSVKLNLKLYNNSAGIASRLQARRQRTEVRFSSRTRVISVRHSIDTRYAAHAVSYSGVQSARFLRVQWAGSEF